MYTLGNHRTVLKLLKQRTLTKEGKFIIPYINNRMRILDYGCGLATISQGLHEKFIETNIFGVDTDSQTLKKAKQISSRFNNSATTKFVAASVFQIPFKDESFDFAFGNTILMQLTKPSIAIHEIKRVLLPEGIIAIREPDYSLDEYSYQGFLYKFWDIFCKMLILDGGDPFIGSRISDLLIKNGFEVIELNIVKSTPDHNYKFNKLFSNFVNEAEFLRRAQKTGMVSENFFNDLRNNILEELKNPKFNYKRTHFEIIATRKN